tara:strand:+ start:1279 stop:1476 length:198 start_codon:yes stop_codon:yes gene_type:complete
VIISAQRKAPTVEPNDFFETPKSIDKVSESASQSSSKYSIKLNRFTLKISSPNISNLSLRVRALN